jgi:hypothetical protein
LLVGVAAAQQSDPTFTGQTTPNVFRTPAAPAGGWLSTQSDNFNRPNAATLGANWTDQVGSAGIIAGTANGTGSGNQWTAYNAAGPNSATTTTACDAFHGISGGLNYTALVLGDGTNTGGLFFKIQGSAGSFTQVGLYRGFNGGGWGGGSGFFSLATPTPSARISVTLSNGGDDCSFNIDNNFDGIVDETFLATGIQSIGGITLAPGAGLGFFGDGVADNWGVQECPSLENFEHNTPTLYSQVSGTGPASISSAAGYMSAYGMDFLNSAWHYRNDTITSPGNAYRWYVNATGGRIYCGVGASAAGTISAVLAPNTSSIILQANAAYGFADIASAPFVPTAGTWYQLELVWDTNGDMTVSIYDEAGTSQLATTGPAASGTVTPGGSVYRGFGGTNYVDNLRECAMDSCVTEDFETSLAAYTTVSGTANATLTGAAAHDGAQGAEFTGFGPAWYYRTDRTFTPGNSMRAFVRASGATDGRIYLGFAADAAGCYSVVFAPNTSNIILQANAGYGFSDLASAPFAYAAGTWYQIEVVWAANGDVVANLWNEAGTALLASTPPTPVGLGLAKGIAFRGFATGINELDTINGTDCGTNGPSIYCVAKVNSLGCTPEIAWAGIPSATAATPFFQIAAFNVRNNKAGLLFYTVAGGQNNATFQCGTLCIGTPIRRTPAQFAGGTPNPTQDCSGFYLIDMNDFSNGTGGGNPSPALKVPGTTVNCQWFSRDQGFTPPCNTGLTNAVEYTQGV